MVISGLKGGLGNYLFQIAVGYSLAKQNSCEFKVEMNNIIRVHSDWTLYKDNIFRKIDFEENIPNKKVFLYESLTYQSLPYWDKICLDGYFQSDKYFYGRDSILNLFEIDVLTLEYLNEKYGDILKMDSCSIHVRRGDFLQIPFYNKLTMEYYDKAIELIGKDKKFVVFSNDIQWCKNNFKDIDVVFIENEKDYIDLYLMSKCKYNITSNSTFSWWGSYLNNNPDRMVITPNIWFVNTHSNKDIVPNDWIRI